MRNWKLGLVLGLSSALTFTSCGGEVDPAMGADDTVPIEQSLRAPDGKGGGTADHPYDSSVQVEAGAAGNGISYHGGPVLLGQVNIYLIWYGNFSAAAKQIITDWGNGIGGSPYFNINTTYYNKNKQHVSNKVHLAGQISDNYSRGKSIQDSDIEGIVQGAISAKKVPKDTNAVYFVLTASDVDEGSGAFCGQYCGWHNTGTLLGSDIKYAFIGNPAHCPNNCLSTNRTKSPNGDVGADGIASIISHELEEATTDPDLNAWYDSATGENADKCAWKFGSTYSANGATANMKIGARNFLIQMNWVNAGGGKCAKSYP